jgi:hypothetical protein
MKKIKILLFILALPLWGRSQSIADDLKQLSLDYQKLAGLKSVLNQMYQGYEVVNKGYNAVKDVSKGSFSLHEAFLDGLLVVSPTVRKYPKVTAIITGQASLVTEYHTAWAGFRQDRHFTPDEAGYMLEVYNNLISLSLKNLDELSMVMSDNQLRMSDAERIQAIDRIYNDGHEQLDFLRRFNRQSYALAVQRARQDNDRQTLKNLYGIK